MLLTSFLAGWMAASPAVASDPGALAALVPGAEAGAKPARAGEGAAETDEEALRERLFGSDAPAVEAEVSGLRAAPGQPLGAWWPLGLLALGGLAWAGRGRLRRDPAPAPLHVLGQASLGRNTGVVLVEVEDGTGGRRRMLVGTGGQGPVLLAHLGEGTVAAGEPPAVEAPAAPARSWDEALDRARREPEAPPPRRRRPRVPVALEDRDDLVAEVLAERENRGRARRKPRAVPWSGVVA